MSLAAKELKQSSSPSCCQLGLKFSINFPAACVKVPRAVGSQLYIIESESLCLLLKLTLLYCMYCTVLHGITNLYHAAEKIWLPVDPVAKRSITALNSFCLAH